MLEPAEVKRWQRLSAAMLRHAAEDDPEAFAQVVKVLDGARDALAEVANDLRADGYSWAALGDALGVTRSAAQQRFRAR